MRSFSILIFGLTLALHGFAQSPLRVVTSLTPEQMVNRVLLSENAGINITSVDFEGNPHSLGVFVNESQHYLIRKGLILSTGEAEDAIGPNNEAGKGLPVHQPGNAWLDELSADPTRDACKLSITFVPEFDSLHFSFVFASEEYPEFVNKKVNDIFAFFLEEKSSGKRTNLAVIPGTGEAINVDNINASKHPDLYIENAVWDNNDILKWKDDPGRGELALTYQFDGFTKILAAGAKLQPGKTYEITFLIADVGDDLYDSAVFLEEKSFGSSTSDKRPEMASLRSSLRSFLEEENGELVDQTEGIRLRLQINFDVDSYELNRDSAKHTLDQLVRVMKLHPEMLVKVVGHTDNSGTSEHNNELSLNRARSVVNYLMKAGISEKRMSYDGRGSTTPVADNCTATGRYRNRRVEFDFRLKP